MIIRKAASKGAAFFDAYLTLEIGLHGLIALFYSLYIKGYCKALTCRKRARTMP